MQTAETYQATYTNPQAQTQIKNDATTLNLTTGAGANINTTLKAYVGSQEVANGKEVNCGEIIKYVITVENTGNKTADKIDIKAKIPENTKYVQYKKQIAPEKQNTAEEEDEDSDEQETTDEYVESEKNEDLSASITNLEAGAKKAFSYEVKVDKYVEDNTTIENQITVNYEGNEENLQISHTAKESEMVLTLAMFERKSETLKTDEEYVYRLVIENLTDQDLNNVKLKFDEDFTIKDVAIVNEIGENSLDGNNYTIEKITAGYSAIYNVYVQPEKPNNKKVNMDVIANNKYRSNQVSEDIIQYKVNMQMTSQTQGDTIQAGDKIDYNLKITNQSDTELDEVLILQQIPLTSTVKKVSVNGEELSYSMYSAEEDDDIENDYKISYICKLEKNETKDILIETQTDANEYAASNVSLRGTITF